MQGVILATTAAILIAAGPAMTRGADNDRVPLDHGTVVVNAPVQAPASPDIFGTVALGAGVTAYGARWRRVSAADEADPRVRALAAAAMASGGDPVTRLAAVHADVGRRIRWRRDLDCYRVSDYWAQAGETLTRGEGDGEDIAILKMQVLKAAGFAPRDLYLSLGHDRSRGADSLLLVRVGSEFYALDDRQPLPQRASGGLQFKPVITLGRGSAWVHGRRIEARPARPILAALR